MLKDLRNSQCRQLQKEDLEDLTLTLWVVIKETLDSRLSAIDQWILRANLRRKSNHT